MGYDRCDAKLKVNVLYRKLKDLSSVRTGYVYNHSTK